MRLVRPTRGCAPALAALILLAAAPTAMADTATFSYTGAEQTFSVPAGVSHIQITAVGAPGGTHSGGIGGRAASVTATVSVSPGQVLYVEVGGTATKSARGFNGGGLQNGGGASDVRTTARSAEAVASLNSRLIVAAGGGGPGSGVNGKDADTASAAGGCSGGTATQSAGGAGGSGADPGQNGSLGEGGNAAPASGDGPGGGGGGYYGGGGAAADLGCPGIYGGGGGGSSLVPAGGTSGLVAQTTPSSVSIAYNTAPPPDTTAPTMSVFAISPARFVAANSGPAVVAAVGGRVYFRLSEPAAVKFTVERKARGHRRGRRCVAKGKGRRCTRYVKVRGTFSWNGEAGLNTFRFMGRVRGKALRRGSYRLVGVAADAAGNRSRARRASFAIK